MRLATSTACSAAGPHSARQRPRVPIAAIPGMLPLVVVSPVGIEPTTT